MKTLTSLITFSSIAVRTTIVSIALAQLLAVGAFGAILLKSSDPTVKPLSTTPEDQPKPAEKPKEADADTAAKTAYDKLGFSAGVAAIYMFKDEAVEDASVDAGNVIRANKLSRARTTAILQAYYPVLNDVFQRNVTQQLANRSITSEQPLVTNPTPVMGIQALLEMGGKDVIRSFGVGVLWSWRKYEVDSALKIKVVAPAFNLGIAALIEPNVKTLGSGLSVNKPLPAGDAIRYDTKPGFGMALTFSAGF